MAASALWRVTPMLAYAELALRLKGGRLDSWEGVAHATHCCAGRADIGAF